MAHEKKLQILPPGAPDELPALGSLCYGSNCNVKHRFCIVMGDGLTTERDGQLLIGSAAANQSLDLTEEMYLQMRAMLTEHSMVQL